MNLEEQKAEFLAEVNKNTDARIKNLEEKGLYTKAQADTFKEQMEDMVKQMNSEQLQAVKDASEKLEKATTAKLESEVGTIKGITEDLNKTVKAQGNAITQFKTVKQENKAGSKLTWQEKVENLVAAVLCTEEFTEISDNSQFAGKTSKKMTIDYSGDTPELKSVAANPKKLNFSENATKAVVPLTSHTGDQLITNISDVIRDDAYVRTEHIRDLFNVQQTDNPQIAGGTVLSYTDALTLGAAMYAENAQIAESVFTSGEATWEAKRIGNSIRFSNSLLATNGLKWLINHVISLLPEALYFVEDNQLLNGDGAGNNVKGLNVDADTFNMSPNTYATGDFTSVATYNAGAQTLLTFTAAHNLTSGDTLNIANATHAGYNGAHTSIQIVNATQILLDVAYVVEASLAAWTGTGDKRWKNKVADAQDYDVLIVNDGLLSTKMIRNSGHVVNPDDKINLSLLKDKQAAYLGVDINNVNGKPIIATYAQTSGRFLSGDFSRQGAELYEFAPLSAQFVTDVESVQKDEIVLVISEKIIFPIYNPKSFIKGVFETASAAILKP